MTASFFAVFLTAVLAHGDRSDYEKELAKINTLQNVDFLQLKKAKINGVMCRDTFTFSPDGKKIIAAANRAQGWTCAVRFGVWEISSGRLIHFNARDPIAFSLYAYVGGLVYTPDGSQLVVAGSDGKIIFRNAKTFKIERVIQEAWKIEPRAVPPVKPAYYYDIFGPDELEETFFLTPGFHSLAISADGKFVAAGMLDNTVQIWNCRTGKHLRQLGKSLAVKKRYPIAILFKKGKSPKRLMRELGKTNPAGTGMIQPTHFEIWAVPSTKRHRVSNIVFSPDGKRLIANHKEGICAWDVTSGKKQFAIPDDHSLFVLSPNGKWIAPYHWHQKVMEIYDATTGQKVKTFPKQTRERPLVFSADSQRIFSTGKNGQIRISDVRTGRLLRLFFTKPPKGWLNALRISPDGKKLIGHWRHWRQGCRLRLWEMKTGKEIVP